MLAVVLGSALTLLLLGIAERRRHERRLECVPWRISINGSRGKSTVARLATGTLTAGGLRTMDKTTVSATNTLSNFFGSGLAVSGFWATSSRTFSRDPESVNAVAPGKRPRSFVAPVIVARDGEALVGLGSPGGRRIPSMIAQVVVRWAGHSQPLSDAIAAPRFHLEGAELQFETSPPSLLAAEMRARGYAVVDDIPFPEYYGAIKALMVDPETYQVSGVADERRDGTWRAGEP